ncbi:hypothetical protein BGZ65_006102 [Modicella reniformis]|uniref:Uncharacterized protein n=1 Tax=Modicella reniformis TaxID=1440133 RepID=A0A9P6JHY3_9FUNG|nr:hypothetical protein BGZ65_006102 [Modicella reniformis]
MPDRLDILGRLASAEDRPDAEFYEPWINLQVHLGTRQKTLVREKALALASNMIQHHPRRHPNLTTFTKVDRCCLPSDYDANLQEQYISRFSNTGLSKPIQAQMRFANEEDSKG